MNSTKFLSGLLLMTAVAFTSCNRDKSCKATVQCKDANGQPIKGADVLLYAEVKPNVKGDIQAQGKTDENGRVSFIFKLPAIFNVNAQVASKEAKGMIKLEEGKETTETLTVQ
jgi:hypothetical protein